MRVASGSTDKYLYFVALDSTDLKTRETGLSSFTVYRSRNGGASSVMTTPTINETDVTNMPGVYELLLDEDTTLDAGADEQEMCFHITQASMAPVTRVVEVYRPKATEGNTLGVESDGDLTKVNTCDTNTDMLTAAAVLTTQMTEAYAAAGVAPTLAQAVFYVMQHLRERGISSTTETIKKLDGSTTAATNTINDATNPTSVTAAT